MTGTALPPIPWARLATAIDEKSFVRTAQFTSAEFKPPPNWAIARITMYGLIAPAPKMFRIEVPNTMSTTAMRTLRTAFASPERASTFAAVTSSFGSGIANS